MIRAGIVAAGEARTYGQLLRNGRLPGVSNRRATGLETRIATPNSLRPTQDALAKPVDEGSIHPSERAATQPAATRAGEMGAEFLTGVTRFYTSANLRI